MSFYKFLFNYARQYAFPVFKSFFKAYKDVTGGAKPNTTGGSSTGQKQHIFDQFFSSMVSKTNLSAPPLTDSTAMQILNIDKNVEQLDSKQVLKRYYTLFKKNDPSTGGTAYLQSKIFAAKQCIMARYPNAAELQHEFYKQVIEPEQKKQSGQEQPTEQEVKDNKNDKQEKK